MVNKCGAFTRRARRRDVNEIKTAQKTQSFVPQVETPNVEDDGVEVELNVQSSKKHENFVPESRSLSFVEDLLKNFGDPIPVQVGLKFKDANSAVEEFYKELKDLTPKNIDTGWDINISKDEIKKFIQLKPKSAWGLLHSLPEIITRAKYDGKRPDKKNRKNVLYHRFFARIGNEKNIKPAVLTVREITDQTGLKKYYDVSLVSEKVKPSSDREASNASRDFPEEDFLVKIKSKKSSKSQEDFSYKVFNAPNDAVEIRKYKKAVAESGWQPEKVKKLVNKYYKKEHYNHLFENLDNVVFLSVPSTQGRNTIPFEFAKGSLRILTETLFLGMKLSKTKQILKLKTREVLFLN